MIAVENKVSSDNSSALERNSCGKSLMYLRKSFKPRIEAFGTPISTKDHFDDDH